MLTASDGPGRTSASWTPSVAPSASAPAGATVQGPAAATLARVDASIPASEARLWGSAPAPRERPDAALSATNPAAAQTRPAALTGMCMATPDTVTLARLSSDVYNAVGAPPEGWRVATPADLAAVGVRPTDLTSPVSGFRARVYAEGTGAATRYVVAFRGSTSDRSDWVSNGRQAAGLSTDHYARALQVGRLIGLSGNRNVTITGHSLGGGLASAAGLAAGLPTTTFNASGLSAATISAANGIRATTGRSEADIRAYYVRGEILSTIQDGGDRVAGSLLGRALGSILGPAGGVAGGIAGAQVDAPEAYGTRIALDPVRPEGTHWWDQHAANFHRMPWVLAALGAQ